MRLRAALLAAVLTPAPAAALAAPPAPSLSLSAAFAPPSGVARADFADSIQATSRADALDGDRVYTVGETGTGTGGDTAIVARRLDGALDTGFSEDGKLVLPVAAASTEDAAVDVVVLGDHRLRVLVAMGTGTTRSAAVVGLNADGTPDTGFGAGDGTADGIAYLGTTPQQPAALALGPGGVLALTGADAQSGNDDTFVTLLDAAGAPVPSFGTGGTVRTDRSGTGLADAGVDVAFRGDGPVVLERIGPDASVTAALHAFRADGSDDPSFAGSGVLALGIGEAPVLPTALLAEGGRLWLTGSTHTGVDTNAFLARVESDGSGLQSRQFDMRGRLVDAAQAVTSQGNAIAISPEHDGIPKTVVVAGLVTYGSSTDWAAAAFNGADGALDAAGVGDIAISAPGTGGLSAIVAVGDGTLAVTGPFQENSNYRIGEARLLIDAEKTCNLSLAVTAPLELSMNPFALGDLTLAVQNGGSRACGGSIAPAAPYFLSREGSPGPLAVPALAPGDKTTIAAQLGRLGSLLPQDTVTLTLTSAADSSTADNAATLRVRFLYCRAALALARGGTARFLPTQGARSFSFVVRNSGTAPCADARLKVSRAGRRADREAGFGVPAGGSATDVVRVRVRRPGKAGDRVAIRFRATVPGDATGDDDAVVVRPRLLAVGDSGFGSTRGAARSLHGLATAGRGDDRTAVTRVTRVDVAVRRLGGRGCRWLAARGPRFRVRHAGAKGRCTRPLWLRAKGTARWRVATRSLPPGRYEALSRATIGAGFPEASFTAKDGNRVTFAVR